MKKRPGITFKDLGIKVERVDSYISKENPRWHFWKPRYVRHTLAMTKNAIYDICTNKTEECEDLFGTKATKNLFRESK